MSRAVATSESPTLTEASTSLTPLPSVNVPAGSQGDQNDDHMIGFGI